MIKGRYAGALVAVVEGAHHEHVHALHQRCSPLQQPHPAHRQASMSSCAADCWWPASSQVCSWDKKQRYRNGVQRYRNGVHQPGLLLQHFLSMQGAMERLPCQLPGSVVCQPSFPASNLGPHLASASLSDRLQMRRCRRLAEFPSWLTSCMHQHAQHAHLASASLSSRVEMRRCRQASGRAPVMAGWLVTCISVLSV